MMRRLFSTAALQKQKSSSVEEKAARLLHERHSSRNPIRLLDTPFSPHSSQRKQDSLISHSIASLYSDKNSFDRDFQVIIDYHLFKSGNLFSLRESLLKSLSANPVDEQAISMTIKMLRFEKNNQALEKLYEKCRDKVSLTHDFVAAFCHLRLKTRALECYEKLVERKAESDAEALFHVESIAKSLVSLSSLSRDLIDADLALKCHEDFTRYCSLPGINSLSPYYETCVAGNLVSTLAGAIIEPIVESCYKDYNDSRLITNFSDNESPLRIATEELFEKYAPRIEALYQQTKSGNHILTAAYFEATMTISAISKLLGKKLSAIDDYQLNDDHWINLCRQSGIRLTEGILNQLLVNELLIAPLSNTYPHDSQAQSYALKKECINKVLNLIESDRVMISPRIIATLYRGALIRDSPRLTSRLIKFITKSKHNMGLTHSAESAVECVRSLTDIGQFDSALKLMDQLTRRHSYIVTPELFNSFFKSILQPRFFSFQVRVDNESPDDQAATYCEVDSDLDEWIPESQLKEVKRCLELFDSLESSDGIAKAVRRLNSESLTLLLECCHLTNDYQHAQKIYQAFKRFNNKEIDDCDFKVATMKLLDILSRFKLENTADVIASIDRDINERLENYDVIEDSETDDLIFNYKDFD